MHKMVEISDSFSKTIARWVLGLGILVPALLLGACGGGEGLTRERMIQWGQALKFHIATSQGNEFPETLRGVEEGLCDDCDATDGWGTPFHYRKWRDDRYDLISAGANATLGDGDDVVMANGKFTKPSVIYAERPLKK